MKLTAIALIVSVFVSSAGPAAFAQTTEGPQSTRAANPRPQAPAFAFTDDPLVSQVTPVKALHLTELRTAINALRAANGLTGFSFTDPVLTSGSTSIKGVHITELRSALDDVYDALAQAHPAYTDPSITTGAVVVKAIHITELRTSVVAVESAALSISSLSVMTSAPMRLLRITGTGFDPLARMWVLFTDASERTVQIRANQATTTTLDAAVPPFVDAGTGLPAAGVVNVRVVKEINSGSTSSNVIDGFQIQNLPASPLAAGEITLAFLKSARSQALALRSEPLESGVVDALDTMIEDSAFLVAQTQGVVDNPAATFSMGTLASTTLTVTSARLATSDRMLLAVLQALAAQPPTAAAVGAALEAPATPACAQPEAADAVAKIAAADPNSNEAILAVLKAPRSSVGCDFASAVNTTLLVVGGGVAVGVSIAALLGAAGVSVALAPAVLLGITIALAGGQIGIGGALGQTTAGAGQLVQQGMEQLDGVVKDLLTGFVIPEGVGDFVTLFNGIKDLSTAFTESILPPPAPPPPGPTITAIAFTAVGALTSAVITPAVAGVSVHYSDVGTDGFTLSGNAITDATGSISFGIPPGDHGVVDTIIVTVPGGPSATTTHVW